MMRGALAALAWRPWRGGLGVAAVAPWRCLLRSRSFAELDGDAMVADGDAVTAICQRHYSFSTAMLWSLTAML